MNRLRLILFAAVLLLSAAAAWYFLIQPGGDSAEDSEEGAHSRSVESMNPPLKDSNKNMTSRQNPDFPINDRFQLPFLGVIQCHSRHEKVKFNAGGKDTEWPFKVYYLPDGKLVRAEFIRAGAKDYEKEVDLKQAETLYRSMGQFYVGLPEKTPRASLGKVLENIYANRSFDTAVKISVVYVLMDQEQLLIKSEPRFVANIWGATGGMKYESARGDTNLSNDDLANLKDRMFLDQDGVIEATDNASL